MAGECFGTGWLIVEEFSETRYSRLRVGTAPTPGYTVPASPVNVICSTRVPGGFLIGQFGDGTIIKMGSPKAPPREHRKGKLPANLGTKPDRPTTSCGVRGISKAGPHSCIPGIIQVRIDRRVIRMIEHVQH